MLATPLTVCIAVLGRHVRSLRFLAVIFADEPALTPHVRFYQRLLARDEDEAGTLVHRKLHELGPVAMFDEMLIPALALSVQHRAVERDHRGGCNIHPELRHGNVGGSAEAAGEE